MIPARIAIMEVFGNNFRINHNSKEYYELVAIYMSYFLDDIVKLKNSEVGKSYSGRTIEFESDTLGLITLHHTWGKRRHIDQAYH